MFLSSKAKKESIEYQVYSEEEEKVGVCRIQRKTTNTKCKTIT